MIDSFSNLRPFRFWCQKVLPLVYDDSLSYYELLCKVVNYVNSLIGDTNKLATGYTELKQYVDNYFNELDVSDEIDAKLDAMAEDGRLATLFAEYITRNYNTVADMIADTSLDSGMGCNTSGYYSIGDGFGSRYAISNTNDGTGFAIANGKYAIPICNGVFNIGVNREAPFKTVLESACGLYSKIIVPSGTYNLTGTVEVTTKTLEIDFTDAVINGDLQRNMVNGVRTAFGFKFTNCNVRILNGTFNCKTYSGVEEAKDYSVIPTEYSYLCHMFYFKGCNAYIDGAKSTQITNCHLFGFDDCINVECNNAEFIIADTEKKTLGGFMVQNTCNSFVCRNSKFINFNHSATYGGSNEKYCYPVGTGFYRLGQGEKLNDNFTVEDCYFEDCGWEAVDSHSSLNVFVRNCRMKNCYRFITAYIEGNIRSGNNGGNVYIENCYCYNDPTDSDSNCQWVLTSLPSEGFVHENYYITNCVFIAKVAQAAILSYTNAIISNCVFDLQNSTHEVFYHRHANVVYDNVRIKNSRRLNGAIECAASLIEVRNCRVIPAQTGNLSYSMIDVDKYSHVEWDKNGVAYSSTGAARSLIARDLDRYVRGGEYYSNSNNTSYTYIWSSTVNNGFGIFSGGSPTTILNATSIQGQKYCDISSSDSFVNNLVPNLNVRIYYNGSETGEVKNVTNIILVPADENNTSFVRIYFSSALTETGDIRVEPVQATGYAI